MQFAVAIRNRLFQWRTKISTVAVGVFALYIGFHVVFGANGITVYQHKRAEHERLVKEVQEMQAENERLQHDIQNLKTDPKTIEKEAREQWKYARPGEVVFVLPAPKQEQVPVSAENLTSDKQLPK